MDRESMRRVKRLRSRLQAYTLFFPVTFEIHQELITSVRYVLALYPFQRNQRFFSRNTRVSNLRRPVLMLADDLDYSVPRKGWPNSILSTSLAFHLPVILLPGLHGSSVLTGYKIAFLQCAKLRRECSANSNYDFQGLVIHTYKKQRRSFVTGSSKSSIKAPQKQLYTECRQHLYQATHGNV